MCLSVFLFLGFLGLFFFFFFFFSSRRRHTICSRDWSSDVCSSDLPHRSADSFWTSNEQRHTEWCHAIQQCSKPEPNFDRGWLRFSVHWGFAMGVKPPFFTGGHMLIVSV